MEFNIATELNNDTINGLVDGKYDICVLKNVDKDEIKKFGELIGQDLGKKKEVGIGNDKAEYNLKYGKDVDIGWHSDSSYVKDTHKFAALYGVEVERDASSTYFCNMKSVWRDLPAELKYRIKKEDKTEFSVKNWKDKGNVWPFSNFESEKQEKIYLRIARQQKKLYQNDEFGEYLFYSPYYTNIDYINPEDVFKDEYIYEHRWSTGDLVVWNNMTMSHRRAYADENIVRKLIRYAVNISPAA